MKNFDVHLIYLFVFQDELEALEAIQQRQKTLNIRQVLSVAEQLFKIYYQQMAPISSPSSNETSLYDIIDQSYKYSGSTFLFIFLCNRK